MVANKPGQLSLTNDFESHVGRNGTLRLLGIDSLRFWLATWVVFSHGAKPPIFAGYDTSNALLRKLNALYEWSFNGQAAVIMFFLVSGLCIHWPYRQAKRIEWKRFLAARLTRIGLPLCAAIALASRVGYKGSYDFMHVVPIWSLYCEIGYYCVYPLVFMFLRRFGPMWMMLASVSVAILVIAWKGWGLVYYQDVGGIFYWRAAILGFPCWLFGVVTAHGLSVDTLGENRREIRIGLWRAAAWILQAPLFVLASQGIVGTPVTLTMFSFFCWLWLRSELLHYAQVRPIDWIERLGRASYSLYLVHPVALFLATNLTSKLYPGHLAAWLAHIGVTATIAFSFYILVEAPSHHLARRVGQVFERSPQSQ
jgi:peptidoglycan/LPS O-acetylase OafA/YrhL